MEENDKNKSCLTIKQRRTLIWITMLICTGLAVTGFFVPPMGVIDGSVLTAIGEIGGFSCIFVGIETNNGIMPLFTKKTKN